MCIQRTLCYNSGYDRMTDFCYKDDESSGPFRKFLSSEYLLDSKEESISLVVY
jgi:hypothetical protein